MEGTKVPTTVDAHTSAVENERTVSGKFVIVIQGGKYLFLNWNVISRAVSQGERPFQNLSDVSIGDLEFELPAVVNLAKGLLYQQEGQGLNCLKLQHPEPQEEPKSFSY